MNYPPLPALPEIPAALEFTPVRVTYYDTDQMGHVYYSKYLVWFEIGRTEWLRSRGCRYSELENNGIFLPVAEAHCEYLKSAAYDDAVTIVTWIAELRRVSVTFGYEIRRHGSEQTPCAPAAPSPLASAAPSPLTSIALASSSAPAPGARLEPPKRGESSAQDAVLARGWTRHAFVDRNRKIVKVQGDILRILQSGI